MSYDKKPEMIFFDVGGTLFKGSRFSARDGFSALRKSAVNPEVTTDDFLALLWDEFMENTASDHRSLSGTKLDFHLSTALKYVTMKAGLRFEISMYEQEEIFDRHNSLRHVIYGVPELLAQLYAKGIRAAVISNNAMSGEGLRLAIDRWIPENKMEFCLTSADILLTKPDKDIFLCAASYAGVKPENCWYCGDSIEADVDGAKNAGMTPVLLDTESENPFDMRKEDGRGEYLAVNSWSVLEDYIKINLK